MHIGNNQQNSEKSIQDILENGFVSLAEAASNYGYTTDHLRRLIRWGHIEAVRHGSKGNLYIKIQSLENYQAKTAQSRFSPITQSVPTSTPTTSLSLFIGGILFLYLFFPTLPSDLKNNFDKHLKSSIADQALSVLDNFKNLFSKTQQIQVIEKTIIRHIYEQGSNNIREVTIQGKETIKEIVKESQSLPSTTLATIESRLSDFDTKLSDISSQLQHTPTVISLPSTNTKGVGSITMNPQKVDTETLSVSSSATLSSLDVTNNATISGNLTISGTTTFNQAITSNKSIEIQGTASSSYGLFSNTIQVGSNSSVSYSRFGSSTTSHANYIDTTNDLLISGDLEINGSASFDSFVSITNSSSASFEIWGGGSDVENKFTFISGGASHELLHLTNNLGSRIVTIASGGNVGIGTTSPSSLLSIYNSTATASFDITSQGSSEKKFTISSNYQGAGTSDRFSILNSLNTELFTIASSGFVGIGIASPSAQLSISSTATASLNITSGTNREKRFTIRSNYQGAGTSDRLSIFNGASVSLELFTIASSGYVGIGTNNLVTKFQVSGTASISGATTLRGLTYTWPESQSANTFLQTNGSGALSWAGVTTTQTSTSTGTQDDFAQTAARHLILRLNNASLLTITGFTAGTDGDIIDVISVGAGNVELSHQTGSTAANQLINIITVGRTPLAAGKGTARYVYDGTTTRWRLLEHDQGDWITPTFSAGEFSGSGSMTWTVDSSDINQDRYYVTGRIVHYVYYYSTTTIGGSGSNSLYRKLPHGWSGIAVGTTVAPMGTMDNTGTQELIGAGIDGATPTNIGFSIVSFSGGGNFLTGTNNNAMTGQTSIPLQ